MATAVSRSVSPPVRVSGSAGTLAPPRLHWSNKQRDGHSLHEVPYRACFKPELPRYFIERCTKPGELVYDPFMGRGTTPLEAKLLGRIPAGNDANPLSRMLLRPRLSPPRLDEVQLRLATFDFSEPLPFEEELLVFYHPDTLRELTHLRAYFLRREAAGELDGTDRWIRMIAITRLTGHSAGYFSVYTLPPNQAVSIESQRKINTRLNQTPGYRDVKSLILRKTRSMLRDALPPSAPWESPLFEPVLLCGDAAATPGLPDASVKLVVTSPPFLDVVDYPSDNWLRMWFCGLPRNNVPWLMPRRLEDWEAGILRCFQELNRVLAPGGHAAVEVGEVRRGSVPLDQSIVRLGCQVGWRVEELIVQSTTFTKTAHCWGVTNNARGTNSQRVALFVKD